MPINKNSLRRYQLIDALLQRRQRRFSINDIAEIVNNQLFEEGRSPVSERMIYNDIKNIMNQFPVNIICSEGRYYYEDATDSIEKKPLTDQEKNILEMAIQTFSFFRGTALFDKFNDVITRLMTGSVLRKLHNENDKHCIQIGEVTGDSGQKWLDLLYNAIQEENCLSIDYMPYQKETKKHTISPYLLKEYRNKWYLVAHAHEVGKTILFKLFRIQDINKTDERYHIDPEFSSEHYFKYSLGVFQMNGQQPITVTLQFQKPLIPLIMENKIHPSMEVVTSSADKLLVTLTVFDTIELKNLILSYGSNVEVIEPLSLRADIKVELQKTLLAYE